jgi:hypothetical protein
MDNIMSVYDALCFMYEVEIMITKRQLKQLRAIEVCSENFNDTVNDIYDELLFFAQEGF